MVLKTNLTKASHLGPRITRMPNDRKPKKRIKGRLDATIDQVALLKSGKSVHRGPGKPPKNFSRYLSSVHRRFLNSLSEKNINDYLKEDILDMSYPLPF